MKKQKGRDYSSLLIWSAAWVTVVRYAAAFIASDMGEIVGGLSDVITVAMGLSGLGMGVLDVIGGAYLFDGWRRKMPASGKKWSTVFKVLTVFVFTLIASGVGILVPFTISRVTHSSMESVLSGASLAWWALLVNLAPYLLIGGVAVGNQVVSVSSQNVPETYQKLSDDEQKLTGNFPNDWRKIRKMLNDEQLIEMAEMSSGDISYKYGVSERTATNWRSNARKVTS